MSSLSTGTATAAERQSIATLKAARDVAATIEALRHQLKADNQSQERLLQLQDELLESTERLCNLLDLLTSWLPMVSDGARAPLSEGIGELRDKLQSSAVKIIDEKLRTLLETTSKFSEGFPLGLSFRLSEQLSALTATIEAMGGPGAMPDDLQERLSQAQESIESLQEIEKQFCFAEELAEKTDLDYYTPPYGEDESEISQHQMTG